MKLLLGSMGAIRWGKCTPTFSDGGDIICHVPHIFLLGFCIWRGFKIESDVCHFFCEELFVLYVTHSQVDV